MKYSDVVANDRKLVVSFHEGMSNHEISSYILNKDVSSILEVILLFNTASIVDRERIRMEKHMLRKLRKKGTIAQVGVDHEHAMKNYAQAHYMFAPYNPLRPLAEVKKEEEPPLAWPQDMFLLVVINKSLTYGEVEGLMRGVDLHRVVGMAMMTAAIVGPECKSRMKKHVHAVLRSRGLSPQRGIELVHNDAPCVSPKFGPPPATAAYAMRLTASELIKKMDQLLIGCAAKQAAETAFKQVVESTERKSGEQPETKEANVVHVYEHTDTNREKLTLAVQEFIEREGRMPFTTHPNNWYGWRFWPKKQKDELKGEPEDFIPCVGLCYRNMIDAVQPYTCGSPVIVFDPIPKNGTELLNEVRKKEFGAGLLEISVKGCLMASCKFGTIYTAVALAAAERGLLPAEGASCYAWPSNKPMQALISIKFIPWPKSD